MMVKGGVQVGNEKEGGEKCCSIADKYCQTDEAYQPLAELPQVSLSNTPSIKSLASPTNLKKN
jgi:hypothetical protein